MERRGFLAAPLAAGLATAGGPDTRIVATGDGVPVTPDAYAELLRGAEVDSYSMGGVVGKLEARMAAELGKETAVWMPTGTLANHLAVRALAGDRRRVLVQAECHLYNDCGDCCQTLSGLTMVPLAPGRATFTVADLEEIAGRSASGRVAVPIGAMQVESPVRRKTGELFDFAEMKRVAAWARERGIGLHLDGARLYLAPAYSGVSVREYAGLFDTVYVSMYKYFGAASGAVLAGPKKLLDGMFHTRRMFGGGQHEAWPFAAVALKGVDGFAGRFARAVATSEEVIAGLKKDGRFGVERIMGGSNLFRLRAKDAAGYVKRARERGLLLGAPNGETITVAVNETWNRAGAAEILARFVA